MEIKKGISQMAEYPNVVINYVVPKSGNMHYVLKDGILDNGVIIATLDPRHAIDEANPCQNIGVFSAFGDILVDFNKKDIKKITDDLLLVVNSVPTTSEVASFGDEKAEENRNLIVQMMMQEMGPTGEMIFDDPYSEANVYATDSYNNKLGLDCSFIGKNNEGLFFHTNDVNSLSKFIKVDEFRENELIENSIEAGFDNVQVEDENQTDSEELQLNINPTILGGFNSPQIDSLNDIQNIEEPTMGKLTSEESENTESSNINVEDDLKEDLPVEEKETEINDIAIEQPDSTDILNRKEITSDEEVEKIELSDNNVENGLKEDLPVEEKETESNDIAIEQPESTDTSNNEEITSNEESDLDQDNNSMDDEYIEEDETEIVEQEYFDEDSDDDLENNILEDDDDDEYDYRYKNKSKSKYSFEEEDDIEMEKPRKSTRRKKVTFEDINNDTEVLDDAIELINKMMEETDRLNRKIKKLETRLEQKEEIIREQTEQIEKQENKKNELNNILNKANRLLDNME